MSSLVSLLSLFQALTYGKEGNRNHGRTSMSPEEPSLRRAFLKKRKADDRSSFEDRRKAHLPQGWNPLSGHPLYTPNNGTGSKRASTTVKGLLKLRRRQRRRGEAAEEVTDGSLPRRREYGEEEEKRSNIVGSVALPSHSKVSIAVKSPFSPPSDSSSPRQRRRNLKTGNASPSGNGVVLRSAMIAAFFSFIALLSFVVFSAASAASPSPHLIVWQPVPVSSHIVLLNSLPESVLAQALVMCLGYPLLIAFFVFVCYIILLFPLWPTLRQVCENPDLYCLVFFSLCMDAVGTLVRVAINALFSAPLLVTLVCRVIISLLSLFLATMIEVRAFTRVLQTGFGLVILLLHWANSPVANEAFSLATCFAFLYLIEKIVVTRLLIHNILCPQLVQHTFAEIKNEGERKEKKTKMNRKNSVGRGECANNALADAGSLIEKARKSSGCRADIPLQISLLSGSSLRDIADALVEAYSGSSLFSLTVKLDGHFYNVPLSSIAELHKGRFWKPSQRLDAETNVVPRVQLLFHLDVNDDDTGHISLSEEAYGECPSLVDLPMDLQTMELYGPKGKRRRVEEEEVAEENKEEEDVAVDADNDEDVGENDADDADEGSVDSDGSSTAGNKDDEEEEFDPTAKVDRFFWDPLEEAVTVLVQWLLVDKVTNITTKSYSPSHPGLIINCDECASIQSDATGVTSKHGSAIGGVSTLNAYAVNTRNGWRLAVLVVTRVMQIVSDE